MELILWRHAEAEGPGPKGDLARSLTKKGRRQAERMAGVSRVFYPGLVSHPDHEIARRQMSGFGGMITFFPINASVRSSTSNAMWR